MMTPLMEPTCRKWFEECREPEEFCRAAHESLGFLYRKGDKFDPPQYLCDAFHAGCFARIWRDDQGPCEVRLLPQSVEAPDGRVKMAHGEKIELEITMALDKDSRLKLDLQRLRDARCSRPITGEELKRSAREAIPNAVKNKVGKKYSNAHDLTVLVITNGSLSPEEMADLTEPWKDCFHAICLLNMMDVVIAWPELRVLKGREPS